MKIYRADTTELTADNTCYSADYVDQYINCNPKGVETAIQRLRYQFRNKLFDGKNYLSNGRCFLIDGVPYSYEGEGEYRDTLLDDRRDATSFFIVRPEIALNEMTGEAIVDIYFMANLTTVFNYSHRPVEELHAQIFNQIKRSQFEITGIVRGFEALSDFEIENPGVMSMRPYYCCKFETKLIFKIC